MARNYGGIQGDYQDLTFVQEERRLQRKLQYFFKNPCQKWREKRRFPGKLTLQLVKIVLATIQLIFFGFSRSAHVDFIDKTSIAFRHLFLMNWSPSYETMPYPPSSGVYAVYTTDDFFSSVDYAQQQYNMTEQISIGTYHFSMENNTKEPMKMCKKHYKEGQIWAYNQSYHFDATVMEDCFDLHSMCDNKTHPPTCTYDLKAYLQAINKSIIFDRLIDVTLTMKLTTVNLKSLSRFNMPDCFLFIVKIRYDNSHHEGRLTVTLNVEEKVLGCDGSITFGEDTRSLIVVTMIFDICVILLSVASMVLCCRSMFKSCWLKQETSLFFRKFYGRELTFGEQIEFLNLWYILIVINDSMIILGSIFKMEITTKDFSNYNMCGVLLGTGNLLAWFGVLRYLSFFETYNILLLTLKRAAPNMLRFLSCAMVFYFGFAVCGWVVLGPYHLKFRSLSTASECLFALVNGDELFITFATINQNGYIWWYSRIYLYCFISLFIYVVLSLFIAIIMETYETIKQSYVNGNPRSELQAFAFRYTPDMSATVSGSLDDLTFQRATLCVCPPPCFNSCFKRASGRRFDSLNDDSLDERSHLISSGEVSS